MRNINTLKTALCILLLFFSKAEVDGKERQDSLYSYLDIAARNNPLVLQRFSEYEAALRKIPQAGALPDPELSLGVFLNPMELASGNQVADIRLMQMFPWFGVLKSAKDEMSLMAKARYETFRDAKLQICYDVERTWYEMVKVSQSISVSEKNLELLQTMERLATVRFGAAKTGGGSGSPAQTASVGSARNPAGGPTGMNNMSAGPVSQKESDASTSSNTMTGNSMGSSSNGAGLTDVYRIQIETGDLQNSIDFLNSRLRTLSSQFNSYLNRPPHTVVSLPDSLEMKKPDTSVHSVPDSILKNNPMLQMLDFEQQSLEARRQMVIRMGFPMVGLGLNYSVLNKTEMSAPAMNGKDMVMPMLTASLPIYRKKYKAMREEAFFLQSANSQNSRNTANSLRNEYYQALQSFQDAERRIKLYAGQYQLASKTLEIFLSGYTASTSSLTDVLRLIQQTLEYSFRQLEAVADYNTAVAWMNRLGNTEDTEKLTKNI